VKKTINKGEKIEELWAMFIVDEDKRQKRDRVEGSEL